MASTTDSPEIALVFIPSMHQKLDELNEVLAVLIEEGPNPSTIEIVYRTSFSLKSLAAAFDQQELVEFIAQEFDMLLNRIRVKGEKPSAAVRTTLTKFVDEFRARVNQLAPTAEHQSSAAPAAPQSKEDNTELLAAIGQMSIWSFHDISNYLAKLQGYAEMLEDCRQMLEMSKMDDIAREQVEELSSIHLKISGNVYSISSAINRIRTARGKTQTSKNHLEFPPFLAELMRSNVFSKFNVSWSAADFPNTVVEQDKTVLELVWVFLWRLLAEWNPRDTSARAMARALTKLAVSPNEELPDSLSIYIWMEAVAEEQERFSPSDSHFTEDSPHVDLGNVGKTVANVAARNGIEIKAAQTPAGHPIFSITLPCRLQKDSQVPQAKKSAPEKLSPAPTPIAAETAEKPYILVVDDEKDLCSLLSVKLTKMGYPVVVAESLAAARTALKAHKVSLVLADLFLSQESGLELLREVRSGWPNVAFLFMSGANEDDVPAAILQVLSMYANGFLKKPIPTEKLKETIAKFYHA